MQKRRKKTHIVFVLCSLYFVAPAPTTCPPSTQNGKIRQNKLRRRRRKKVSHNGRFCEYPFSSSLFLRWNWGWLKVGVQFAGETQEKRPSKRPGKKWRFATFFRVTLYIEKLWLAMLTALADVLRALTGFVVIHVMNGVPLSVTPPCTSPRMMTIHPLSSRVSAHCTPLRVIPSPHLSPIRLSRKCLIPVYALKLLGRPRRPFPWFPPIL